MTSPHEDVLQHIDLLKDVVPSPESTHRAIARAANALLNQGPDNKAVGALRHRPRSTWTTALAACMAVLIGVIACFVFLRRDSVAFGDVQEELRRVNTVMYNFVTGDAGNRVTTRCILSGTRARREERGRVTIRIPDQKITLFINHNDRTAKFLHHNSGKEPKMTDEYSRLVSIVDSSAKEIGKRSVDGKPVLGFEAPEIGTNGAPMRIWVDPLTRLPVRIEASGNRAMQDFEFNVNVSENLFKLIAPDAYFVEHAYDVPQSPINLDEVQLQKYTSIARDPSRSPQETIEAFLKLSAAGKDVLVRKLLRNPIRADEIRELNGFHKLELKEMLATNAAALGITSAAIEYRGKQRAMVLEVKRVDGNWLIDDIDLESADEVQDEVRRFVAEHPDAKEVE